MTRRTTLTAVGPRSAAKIGVAVGVCLFVAWMIAAALVYVLLGATGVWDRVNSLAGDLFAADGVSAGMYFGLAGAVGIVEVVVATLFFPLGAVLYNGVAGYVGGIEVTVETGDAEGEDAAGSAAPTAAPAAPVETAEAEPSRESAEAVESPELPEEAVTEVLAPRPERPERPAGPAGPAAAGWGLRPGTGGAHRAE